MIGDIYMDIKKLQGAWGYDVDSKEFVDKIRKGRLIEPLYKDSDSEDDKEAETYRDMKRCAN